MVLGGVLWPVLISVRRYTGRSPAASALRSSRAPGRPAPGHRLPGKLAIGDCDHDHAGGRRGAQAVTGVLDRRRGRGIDAELARRRQVHVGRRLAAPTSSPETVAAKQAVSPVFSSTASITGRLADEASPSGQPRRQPPDRIDRARKCGHLAVVGVEHPLNHTGVELLGVERRAELVVQISRPFRRAHPHHRGRRLGLPGTAVLGHDPPSRPIPDGLRVDEHAIEVEDQGPQRHAREATPNSRRTQGGSRPAPCTVQ